MTRVTCGHVHVHEHGYVPTRGCPNRDPIAKSWRILAHPCESWAPDSRIHPTHLSTWWPGGKVLKVSPLSRDRIQIPSRPYRVPGCDFESSSAREYPYAVVCGGILYNYANRFRWSRRLVLAAAGAACAGVESRARHACGVSRSCGRGAAACRPGRQPIGRSPPRRPPRPALRTPTVRVRRASYVVATCRCTDCMKYGSWPGCGLVSDCMCIRP